MTGFTLAVDPLTEVAERHVFEVEPNWWAARETEHQGATCGAEAPFRFEFEAVRVGDEIVLDGGFEGRIGLECSRCAKRYSHALRDAFRLVLSPRTPRNERAGLNPQVTVSASTDSDALDPEGERGLAENGLCLGEDLEKGGYRGPVIRLDDFFGEVIALAMPLQPLCRSECPGICPHCGANRSETSCDCVDEKIDSPFAVLAQLKDEEPEG